jgi:oligopeptide transport system ATP-binding protein
MLLAAEPTGTKTPPADDAPILFDATRIGVTFSLGGGFLSGPPHLIHAVDGVSLRLRERQTIGVVGESGSGKSTLGRLLLRLIDGTGHIRFEGRDLVAMDKKALRALRRELQIVFQDPYGSLSPRLTVGEIVTEGLLVHEPSLSTADRARRAEAALVEVGLDPATRNRYPHEFSGGQRQRIAIARAIILKPKVVVLDEPTSALDRSVQKQIIDLLRRLQETHDLSYLFISHDLAVIRGMADYILVMKDGKVVEEGATEQIFAAPREPYTRDLMTAAFALTAFGTLG